MDHYESETEMEAVVQAFESCTTPKGEFTHRSHLTVALWYLLHSNPEEAVQKMREGLVRFLDHHDVGREKYSETLTIFWFKLVQHAINESNQPSVVRTANEVLQRLANPRVVFEYYSEDCLKAEATRRGWVDPDLKSLGASLSGPNILRY